MNIRQRLVRWLTRASSDAGWSIVRGSQPTDYQRTGAQVRRIGWEQNAVVNACARAIVDIIAAVDLEVCRAQSDGTLKVIENHDAATLLNLEPRVGVSGYAHRGQATLHYLLYGNCLWQIERKGRKRVSGLRIIHPEQLQFVNINEAGQVVRYDWRDIQGVTHESPADDILHFRDLSAAPDALFGFPRAASALQDMAADAEATEYVRQIVTNHGTPGLVVATKGYNNADELRSAEDRFNERMTGRGGRGRTVFMNGEEITFEQIGFNLRDLEFPDLRMITRQDICSAFNVDPRVVGVGVAVSDAGLSGVQYREARFRLIQQAVIPVMKAFEAELNRWYMPEFGEGVIRFRPDTLSEMTEDESMTSTRVIAEVGAKIRTIEEARETLGLSADIDPTHHFAGASPLALVGMTMDEAALTPVEKAVAMADAMPQPALPSGASDGPPKPPVRLLGSGITHRMALMTSEDRTTYWREFQDKTDREEGPVLAAIHHLFGSDWGRIAGLFLAVKVLDDAALALLIRQLALVYAAQGDGYRAWVEGMGPLVNELVKSGIEDEVRAGHASDELLSSARARALIRQRIDALARQVTHTTFEQIRGLLLVGASQGMTPRDVADLIHTTVFGTAAVTRAQMIARTEIAGAINQGSFLAALVGRQVQAKQWISQRDELVRPTHVHAEDQGWIPIEKAFDNGLQYPGDSHGDISELANCRCAIAYSAEPGDLSPEGRSSLLLQSVGRGFARVAEAVTDASDHSGIERRLAILAEEAKAQGHTLDTLRALAQREPPPIQVNVQPTQVPVHVDVHPAQVQVPVTVEPSTINVTVEAPPKGAETKDVQFTRDATGRVLSAKIREEE